MSMPLNNSILPTEATVSAEASVSVKTTAFPTAQSSPAALTAPITIFTLPKPFGGNVDQIQQNAIASWQRLAPEVDVLMIGNDANIEAAAAEMGVAWAGNVAVNEHGTPQIDSAFAIAKARTTSGILVYCNCDVILMKDFSRAVARVAAAYSDKPFLAIGRRTDLDVEQAIDFECIHAVEGLLQRLAEKGQRASIACKEFFAFPRSMFDSLPPFAVGRGNWDNWMVAEAKRQSIPVIDVTAAAHVIHQNHDYAHLGQSRRRCYVSGEEARTNQQLAGGRNLVRGSTATHELQPQGKISRRWWPNGAFYSDLPRFAKLLVSLIR